MYQQVLHESTEGQFVQEESSGSPVDCVSPSKESKPSGLSILVLEHLNGSESHSGRM